jgi:hypothetical protein
MTQTSLDAPQITRVSSINRYGEHVTKAFRSLEAAMVEAHFVKLRGHKRVRVDGAPVSQAVRSTA